MNTSAEFVPTPTGRNSRARTLIIFVLVALAGAAALGTRGWLDRRDDRTSWTADSGARLILIIVLDQFRPDYFERARPHFGQGGFNHFFEGGATFTEAAYNHVHTDTCPGHAVISTGTWPQRNGIVANDWYGHAEGRRQSCADDRNERLVGAGIPVWAAGVGANSPRALLVPAFADALKDGSGGRARVFAVGGKSGATVMLGGQRPDAVYWARNDRFVSSTYYLRWLPGWVRRFNGSGNFTRYFGTAWDRVLPIEAYASLGPDDVAAEAALHGLGRTFPLPLDGGSSAPSSDFFRALEATPFHDEVVADFAMELLREEGLGRRGTDLLAIAFSALDRVGHLYGPDSHQVFDAVIRTDRLLERLFRQVDSIVGLDRTLIVLSSDHAVAPLPEVRAASGREPAGGRIPPAALVDAAVMALDEAFGHSTNEWIVYHDFPHIYLDERLLVARGIGVAEAERVAAGAVRTVPGIHAAYAASDLAAGRADPGPFGPPAPANVLLAFHPERSGSVLYEVAPYFIVDERGSGTNHGTGWAYDTRVPVLWRGPGVRAGEYATSATPADIAPTLAALLGLPPSPLYQGRVLEEIVGAP